MKTNNTFFIAIIATSYFSISILSADTYFSCQQAGYSFQTKNNAARCYKASSNDFKALRSCPSLKIPGTNLRVGHFYKKNYKGNKDMCVGQVKVGPVTNVNAVEISCPSGYSKQITSGKDKCRKLKPASSLPPTKAVNR